VITGDELRARGLISNVHEASRVPFRWTIDPYADAAISARAENRMGGPGRFIVPTRQLRIAH
jgi:hypothetical protein